jgi:hypothetical protein
MDDFDELPVWLQRQIDGAFDKARTLPPDPVSTGLVPAAAKKCRPGHDEGGLTNYHSDAEHRFSEGGGFLVEDEPGGFIPDEIEAAEISESHTDSLGLSMIPTAVSHPAITARSAQLKCSQLPKLQYIDLPPDDEDVLSTFSNAAGGWGEDVEGEQAVSRRDWREVCAILLKSRVPSRQDNENTWHSSPQADSPSFPGEDQDMDALVESDLDDSEDEYRSEDAADESTSVASADDGYGLSSGRNIGSARRSSLSRGRLTRRSKRRQQSPGVSEVDTPSRLTARQRKEARKTFALFFPDVASEQLEKQRIMIMDIARVANLLSIKLKTEEVCFRARFAFSVRDSVRFQILEMLEAFSASPDKSIGLTEFESLVMTARLV